MSTFSVELSLVSVVSVESKLAQTDFGALMDL